MKEKDIKPKIEASAEQTKIVRDIDDVLPNMFKDIPLLSIVLGKDDKKDITIIDISFENTSFGEYAIMLLANGEKYRTSGLVVVKQCHELVNDLPIKAHLKRFETPKGEYLSLK